MRKLCSLLLRISASDTISCISTQDIVSLITKIQDATGYEQVLLKWRKCKCPSDYTASEVLLKWRYCTCPSDYTASEVLLKWRYCTYLSDYTASEALLKWRYCTYLSDYTAPEVLLKWRYCTYLSDYTASEVLLKWRYCTYLSDYTASEVLLKWRYCTYLSDYTASEPVVPQRNAGPQNRESKPAICRILNISLNRDVRWSFKTEQLLLPDDDDDDDEQITTEGQTFNSIHSTKFCRILYKKACVHVFVCIYTYVHTNTCNSEGLILWL